MVISHSAILEIATKVPIGVVSQVYGRLAVIILGCRLPDHEHLVLFVDEVGDGDLDFSREFLLFIWARSIESDTAEANYVDLLLIAEVRIV